MSFLLPPFFSWLGIFRARLSLRLRRSLLRLFPLFIFSVTARSTLGLKHSQLSGRSVPLSLLAVVFARSSLLLRRSLRSAPLRLPLFSSNRQHLSSLAALIGSVLAHFSSLSLGLMNSSFPPSLFLPLSRRPLRLSAPFFTAFPVIVFFSPCSLWRALFSIRPPFSSSLFGSASHFSLTAFVLSAVLPPLFFRSGLRFSPPALRALVVQAWPSLILASTGFGLTPSPFVHALIGSTLRSGLTASATLLSSIFESSQSL